MARQKVYWSGHFEAEQLRRLRALNERTRVPVAVLVRDGVNLVLEREEARLAAEEKVRASVALDRYLAASAKPAKKSTRRRRAA